tara:strand:+ start:571 stop:849 length:279 start_codon:yes stop_codon:yes gene_type:complete
MATRQATITRLPIGEAEKKYINYLQAKNHPIITKYIVYDNLTDSDKILCVNPSSGEYVIYEAKLEKDDNYKRMKMLVEYLYEEKKYLIYQLK